MKLRPGQARKNPHDSEPEERGTVNRQVGFGEGLTDISLAILIHKQRGISSKDQSK